MTSRPIQVSDRLSARTEVVIIRHYKERKSKCSVQPLVEDPRLCFLRFEPERRFEVGPWITLAVDAPPLSPGDPLPLLLLDSTWRYLPALTESLVGPYQTRSLPNELETAYPRRSKLGPEPEAGLASIEALYAALWILGRRDDSLLDHYHWRERFIQNCEALLGSPYEAERARVNDTLSACPDAR